VDADRGTYRGVEVRDSSVGVIAGSALAWRAFPIIDSLAHGDCVTIVLCRCRTHAMTDVIF